MGKLVPDAIIDQQLDLVEGTRIHVCSAEPANYAAISGVELAAANVSGSYTKADGDTDGRKTTCPAQSAVPIGATGSGTHVVLSNGTDTLQLVTTCPSQALTSGGTVDIAAFAHTVRDAA